LYTVVVVKLPTVYAVLRHDYKYIVSLYLLLASCSFDFTVHFTAPVHALSMICQSCDIILCAMLQGYALNVPQSSSYTFKI